MASFTFKWPHKGEEVYVTGTFDDWKQTVKLEKVGDVFEKTVTLEPAEKIYYKFVVDAVWTPDHDAPKETDSSGNENNVLKPEDFVKNAPAEAAIISSVGPESTTVALAKDASLEKKDDAAPADTDAAAMTTPAGILNTVTPDATTVALAGAVPLEKKEEKKDEKPAAGLPGAFPETPATEPEKEFKVAPLPATDGALNPIKLAPGENIPPHLAAGQDINSNVKLDPESYEKADALPGIPDLPPVTKNMIPESSLPIVGSNDVTISSVGPNSTTVALAGAVPLEPKVPAVVKESQEKAGVDPEASAIPEEVKEKAEVESELLKKVPEAPTTAEGTAGKGTEKSEADKPIAETVTATAAGLGAAVVASAVAAKDTVVAQATSAAAQLPDSVKQALPTSVQEAITPATKEAVREEVSPEVPAPVKEAIKEAGASPEAAASTAAVEEKKEVEAELLKEVKPAPANGDKATAAAANGPTETTASDAATTTTAAETIKPDAAATATPATTITPETPAKKSTEASASTPAAASASSPATPSSEKKKKNRLSTMFSKIKSKVSSKEKS